MDQRESSVEVWLDVELLFVVGGVGEDAERGKGGREEIEGEGGAVLVRIGANCGLSGVEEDGVEIGESAGEEVVEVGRSVVLRLVGLQGRRERVGIVVVEGGDMVSLAAEERAVCRLVWAYGLVLGGIRRQIGEVESMEATRCKCGRNS